jgi:uncharacterized RDD family membrane protein YckC
MDTLESNHSVDTLTVEKQDELESKYESTTFPSLVTRIKALFIDFVTMLTIFTATTLFIDSFGDIPSFVKGFILIFMIYLYDPILTSLTGSTLGHKVMKLKVRSYVKPEKNISFGRAFLRFFTKGFLGWISFLTVTGNKQKRAIHDLVSGSIVLYDK